VTGHENGTVRMWNIELQTSITITQDGNPHAHSNSICAFAEYIHMRSLDDVTEYMFSAGYEGKVSVWEIFIKKSVVQSTLMSSTISPQLKFSFYPNEHQ
jgi:WD40 repeat protein